MESFHWDTHFETGLDFVDQEHRVLVDLINRFGDMLTHAIHPTPNDSEAILRELIDYSHCHFEHEEGMMLAQRVDPRHIQMHQRLYR